MNVLVRDMTKDYYRQTVDDLLYKIKNKTYPVKVPLLAVLSENYIKKLGIPTQIHENVATGEIKERPDYDYLVDKNFTIEQMMEVYFNGFGVDVINADLVKDIFYTCDAYLYKQKEGLEYRPNATIQDPEFIAAIDEFTKTISQDASRTILSKTYKEVESPFMPETFEPGQEVLHRTITFGKG